MQLSWLDWSIVIAYFLVTLSLGLAFRGRAGKSLVDFFVSGRQLPWWIAGTSMVATTFAADTPLAVTGLVVSNGLAGNWLWWAFAFGGMITTFVYARLWRRAEVVTDVELIELRYSGNVAAALRFLRAIYVALIINPIIIGWVTKAMLTVLKETVLYGQVDADTHDWQIIFVCLAVVGVYATLSGLWGVAITDVIQFVLAMIGCIALAFFAVGEVGGIDAMRERVISTFPEGEQAFRFLPDFTSDAPWMPLHVFIILLSVQWWATWYPGAEPGGGGYVVQRMASCRSERDSLLATLWYQLAHYCLRPWPWLLVAFAAMALYPGLAEEADPGAAFARVMRDVSPNGLRGLLTVTFFAAFMSTISTQMNWGASYLVRDVYQRFIAPEASERHLTRASRVASVVVLVAGSFAAWQMRQTPVEAAWKILLALGAGTGAVFMLRWFWWRINAWTEIAAMAASLVFFLVFPEFEHQEVRMLLIAVATIVCWLLVTYATPPEDDQTLVKFYRQVRPGGYGWKPVARLAPDVVCDRNVGLSCLAAVLAAGIVYSTIPCIGYFIFGQLQSGTFCLVLAALFAAATWALLQRIGWETLL